MKVKMLLSSPASPQSLEFLARAPAGSGPHVEQSCLGQSGEVALQGKVLDGRPEN